MKFYRNYLGSNDEPERESEVGSDDKQKYDIDEIIPFIPKKFENDIYGPQNEACKAGWIG